MTRAGCIILAAMLGLTSAASRSARGGDGSGEFPLPAGDAIARRTDSTNSGALLANQMLPDLTNISLQRWNTYTPTTDPYTGTEVGGSSANLFRLQLTFAGLVNPPGTLGLGGQAFAPMEFGDAPVYGYVELDIDDESDTGGESPSYAVLRPLGQASRFGGRFYGSIGDRQAESAADLNQPWTQQPQVCRSGTDFSLVLCGCFPVTVVSKSDPGAATFGPGQTWVVRGRFFQRAGGYAAASLMTGGSWLGAYDPLVNVQFKHDVVGNTTTLTLVYPLTQAGAAMLSGGAVQPSNTSAADDTSISEGAADLIASSTRPGLTGLTYELIRRWSSASVSDATNPRRWNVRAMVGTTYPNQEDGLYVWSDVGPNFLRRDVSGDGMLSSQDRMDILDEIASRDGGAYDADGLVNGAVVLPGYGGNFSIFDVNGDGSVDAMDLNGIPLCAADWNASGAVTVQDVFDFLTAWFVNAADFNLSGSTTVQDIFDFLGAWFSGC
jgi:hypothetical protein